MACATDGPNLYKEPLKGKLQSALNSVEEPDRVRR